MKLSMIINKRHIILSALVVALGAAVFINWYYTKPEVSLTTEKTTVIDKQTNLGDAKYVNSDDVEELFSEAKLKRSKTHDRQLEELNKVINSQTADEKSKEAASEKFKSVVDVLKAETDAENLITAKLNCDVLVIINDEKARVICENKVNEQSLLQIKEIIIQNSCIKNENITVIEAKNS